MLKAGDKIKYHASEGVVVSVMDNMVIAKLSDGKEYSLPYDAVKLVNGEAVVPPAEMSGAMEALRPMIKNMSFLNELAEMMSTAGINELHVKAGKIAKFEAKESLEEKMARYRAEAIKEAEKKALKEHQQEMSII